LLYGFLLIQVDAVAKARKMVDQTGEEIELPNVAERVVALAPSITEMIYSLGAEDRLVGVTTYSNYPPQAESLPRIGSYVKLDLEKIVALKPDLCLAIKDGNPRRSVDAVRRVGIPVFAIDPRNIEQIVEAYVMLGEVLGKRARADMLAADMNQRMIQVKKRVIQQRSRPRVFFQISDSPIVSAGKNSYIDRLIDIAGGYNLAGKSNAYPRYSWEDILIMQPEVVLLSSMTGERSQDQLKSQWLQWPELPAVKNNRVHVVNADLFNRPTMRLIAGLEMLTDLLHPEEQGESRDD